MSEKRARGGQVWVWAVLISFLLLVGLPILGLVAGFSVVGSRPNRAVGHWRSLGSPPETAVAFVDAGLDLVYVRGQDGSLLECDRSGPTADNACWKRVEQTKESDAWVDRGVAYEGKRAPPPGPVVESLDLVIHRHAEMTTYAQYVLLEDGSVWVWQYTADANTSLGMLFGGPICGLALAVVLVLGMWLVVGVRALVRRRKARSG